MTLIIISLIWAWYKKRQLKRVPVPVPVRNTGRFSELNMPGK